MRTRRIRNTDRGNVLSRGMKKVAGFAAATVLVAGLAFSCKPKEQPKKPVPAVKCESCVKPKPCPKTMDQSKLPYRVTMMSLEEGKPLEITNLRLFLQKATRAEKRGEETFSPRGTSLILGNVTKIDDRGFELSLNLKPSRKVWVAFSQPRCIALGSLSIAVYAEKARSKKDTPKITITYPEAIIPRPDKLK